MESLIRICSGFVAFFQCCPAREKSKDSGSSINPTRTFGCSSSCMAGVNVCSGVCCCRCHCVAIYKRKKWICYSRRVCVDMAVSFTMRRTVRTLPCRGVGKNVETHHRNYSPDHLDVQCCGIGKLPVEGAHWRALGASVGSSPPGNKCPTSQILVAATTIYCSGSPWQSLLVS